MILSVSRRTDIPAYYSAWFLNRLAEGFVLVPNPHNPRLARLLSISVRTLRRYQSGQTRLPGDTLMKLSAIFGVPPEEILMEEDEADDR